MKKTFTLLSLILLVLGSSNLSAKSVQAFLSYTTFNSPEEGPYVETYLSIAANSINFVKKENGKFQGKVEITLIFKQNDSIVSHKKLNLNSPEVEDSAKTYFSFLDVQRFILPNGKYDLELKLKDLNSDKNSISATDEVLVDFNNSEVQISGIELLETKYKTENENILSKNGFDLIPFPFGFYSKYMEELSFYIEIYNTKEILGEGEKFLLKAYIESFDSKKIMNDYFFQKILNSSSVVPFIYDFPIKELPSGNYNLVVEAIDKEENVLERNYIFFQRSNPELDRKPINLADVSIENTFVAQYSNIDTLSDLIKSTVPIASPREQYTIAEILQNSNVVNLQRFFYHFWVTRNQIDPHNEWKKYQAKVNIVNRFYSSQIFRGYETDRGIVYLKYGPPNTILDAPYGPGTAPYEIWHYYQLGSKQSNAKFIFYNPDFIADNYDLIHSNVRGEVYNPNWQKLLFSRAYEFELDTEEWKEKRYWGEDTYQHFKNPK